MAVGALGIVPPHSANPQEKSASESSQAAANPSAAQSAQQDQAQTQTQSAASDSSSATHNSQPTTHNPQLTTHNSAVGEKSAEQGGEHKSGGGASHGDPVAPVLMQIIIILFAAKLGGHLFERLGQPAVLGELVLGMALSSITLWWSGSAMAQMVETMRQEGSYIDILARIGVILLLFEVGLESDIYEMAKVGAASFVVAALGVIAPMFLGYFVSSVFITSAPPGVPLGHVHLFIGAVLCATSVGITARVLKDLNKIHTNEAKIVLGAAVIDDVMGLIVLAVVGGIIVADETGSASSGIGMTAFLITAKALLFLTAAIFLGLKLMPFGFRIMAGLRGSGLMITSALMFCFGVAWIANAIGLATIVGAFAAGLVMGESHVRPFREGNEGVRSLENLIHPLSAMLVPLFFVQMGIQVRLESFARVDVLFLAAMLIIAAVIGKQVCGLGIFGVKADRLSVGLGMIPRGEVGLIFASIGRTLGVVTNSTFAAVVIMVIVTTLVTPPLLKWSLMRAESRAAKNGAPGAAA